MKPPRMVQILLLVVTGSLMAAGATGRAAAADPDRDTKDNIEMLLRSSEAVGRDPIGVEVREGTVTLTGTVRTLANAWAALEVAARTRGVTAIDDRLVIDRRGASDGDIAEALIRRFRDNLDLASSQVVFSVTEGAVKLAGLVTDARVRFQAREAAAETEGVVTVVDAIESPPHPDEKILEEAKKLLGPASLVRVSGKIEPTVKDGEVTLEGVVPRLYERIQAERVVLGINGVKKVSNQLQVKPRPRMDDQL